MLSKLPVFYLILMLIPGLLYAANPDNPKDVDATVVNEPTVHVGSNVDVNVINVPDVDAAIVNQPDVNAHQVGEWNVNVQTIAKTFEEFTGNIQSTDGWVEVYQVPDGKRFVLTDIYFNQRTFGSWLNAISLNRNHFANECGIGTTAFMQTHVVGLDRGERNQVFFPLQTGYEFTEGERICLAQTGGGLIFYNLSGYETDS